MDTAGVFAARAAGYQASPQSFDQEEGSVNQPPAPSAEQLRRECHGMIEALYHRSLNVKLLLAARRGLMVLVAYKANRTMRSRSP